MGCILGQHDEMDKQNKKFYYLNKKFMSMNPIFGSRENLLCFSISHLEFMTLHTVPYHAADFLDGSVKILVRETFPVGETCTMASTPGQI